MNDDTRCWDCAYYHPHSGNEKTFWDKFWMRAKGSGKSFIYANGECHAHWTVMTHGPIYLAGKRIYADRHQNDPSCDRFVQKTESEYHK